MKIFIRKSGRRHLCLCWGISTICLSCAYCDYFKKRHCYDVGVRAASFLDGAVPSKMQFLKLNVLILACLYFLIKRSVATNYKLRVT